MPVVRVKFIRSWFPIEFVNELGELMKLDYGASEIGVRFAVARKGNVGVTHFLYRLSGEKEVDKDELEQKIGELKAKYNIKAVHKVMIEQESTEPDNGTETN